MGTYDAQIRVKIKNDTSDIDALEKRLAKAADRAKSVKEKLDDLDKAGTPHTYQIYTETVAELEKWNRELEKLEKKQKKMNEAPQKASSPVKTPGNFDSISDTVEDLQTRLKDLRNKGFGVGDKKFDALYIALKNAQNTEKEILSNLDKQTDKEQKIAEIKKKAVVEDIDLVALNEKKVQLQARLAELEKAGVGAGYKEYDQAYVEWKNAADAVKEYQKNLDKQTEKGIAEESAKVAREKEKQAEQQRKIEEAAEKNLKKEIARFEQEVKIQKKLEEQSEQLEQQKALQKQREEAKMFSESFKKLRASAGKVFSSLERGVSKVTDRVKTAFSSVKKETKKTSGLLSTLKSRLRGIALSLLVFNWISKGFQSLVSGIQEGFKNLAKYSDEYNRNMSDLISAHSRLKNSIAGAFAPLINVAIPYIVSFINAISKAITKVAEFIAVLTGKSVFLRATKQVKNYRNELEGTASAAKKAAGSLAAFDKLNVIGQNDSAGSGSADGGFEEVPVSSEMKKLSDMVKDIFKKMFSPLKKAWNREGKFVMKSWKNALKEIGGLVKDIGRDFLTMWNEDKTVDLFSNILHIVGDIGAVVKNLTKNFRFAWNQNETGLHILENIRDMFGAVAKNVRHAADATTEWADSLDFAPLLQSFEQFTKSIIPLTDSLSGVLTDFYEKVMLPLGKWTIEKGLPELLQVFTDFNKKVNWVALRQELSDFWDSLEPFAEKVGEGLIIFIRDLSDKIANFTNSDTFKNLLEWLEEKMDSSTPEGIAKGMETIVNAFVGFKVVSTLGSSIKTVKTLIDLFAGAKGTAAAAGMGDLGTALGGLLGVLGYVNTTLGAIAAFDIFIKNGEIDLLETLTGDTETADKMRERYGKLGGTLVGLKDIYDATVNAIQGYGFAVNDSISLNAELVRALDNISNGAIYTDKQMTALKEKFGATDEDIEMLRQAMFDANPDLLDLANGFGLFEASAETLSDVAKGMEAVKDGTILASQAAEEFSKPMWNMTDEAKAFFKELGDGNLELNDYQKEILESLGYNEQMIESWKNTSGSLSDFSDSAALAGAKAGAELALGLKTPSSDLKNNAKSLGQDAVIGFNEGIAQNKSTFEVITHWMDGSVKAIHNSSMRFGSPSRTAMNFGKDTIMGYNQGITNNATKSASAIRSWMNIVKNSFQGIIEAMNEIGKQSIDALIQGMNSKQQDLKNAVNNLTSTVRKSATPSVNPGKATVQSIPHLATGAVIRGGNPYLAVLGDQRIGQTNVEAPLSTIKTALKEALRESGNMGGEYTFVAQLNGRTLYSETVRQDQMQKKMTGRSKLGK